MSRFSFSMLRIAALACVVPARLSADPAPEQPLKIQAVTASSETPDGPASNAIDGKVADSSRWVSKATKGPLWLELDLGGQQQIAGLHLFSGYQNQDPIKDFKIQFWDGKEWQDVPSAVFQDNTVTALAIPFDDTLVVKTNRLRLWITETHRNTARVQGIVVWPGESGRIPPLEKEDGARSKESIVPLYLNQSGFDLGKPKRFTAPTVADGTAFVVRPAKGGAPLFQGVVRGNKGDFSAFDPTGDVEYVVESGGLVSVPFRVGQWWLERVTYQNAVNFMIDSRQYTGNVHGKAKNSYGWRDDHHFGWELNTLVPQLLSNPSAYERMPRQVHYEKPSDPKLWGALEPYKDDAPDIVKLIHWGADVIVTQGVTHEMLKAQLAYFLYAWPVLQRWLPEQNKRVVSEFVYRNWSAPASDHTYVYEESPENNLLALKTKIGTTKGAYPPGFSIQPNLLMYEVAKRDRRADAAVYLKAAVDEAAWIVKNLDWNDPLTTKGQRTGEFVTMTALAQLLLEYPQQAPPGLADKIDAWAKVVIRRSDNMWDFRKLDDASQWTPSGAKKQMWNEVGNVTGFPSACLAAREVIKDPAVKKRLEELAWSHFDNMFGRNPVGRHFSYDAPREIEGVEHGWFSFLAGGIGQLANARFVLDGSPKNDHYPWHPEKGNVGWSEGWIQFNTPFDASLSYLAWSDTKLDLAIENGELRIRLRAPLNFDYTKIETGTVVVTSANGDSEVVTVTEDSVNSPTLSGKIRIQDAPNARPNDGMLQCPKGTAIQASYGFGYLGHVTAIKP